MQIINTIKHRQSVTKNETKTFMQLQQYNKAVYYTKKLCVIFHQSKSSDVHGECKIMSYSLLFSQWWTENSISTVFFFVHGGQKIASRLLSLPSLGTENSTCSTQISIRTNRKQCLHAFFCPWQTKNSLTFAYFSVHCGRKITQMLKYSIGAEHRNQLTCPSAVWYL